MTSAEALAAWYSEPSASLFLGDCRSVLAGLPENSADCVVAGE